MICWPAATKLNSMVYSYIRFSTTKQDDVQQQQAIKEWAQPRGIVIDEFVSDEGVSGGVSYKDRNLYKLVRKLKAGDTLIVSEISRLGRSMSDLNLLITQELKPRKVRLVCIKLNLDLDCANIKAIDEMLLFAFSFAAQLEKELIQARTQSAIDARKEAIKKDGGFMSKSGNWCKKLGNKKGVDMAPAQQSSILARHNKAQGWRESSALYRLVERGIFKGWTRQRIMEEAIKKYDEEPDVYCTRQGKPLCEGTLSRWAKEIQIGI